ncbi:MULTISPECIES: chemotaxis protein CheW [unclassified Colwellia]|uniref:chemotaxis protein CheW n=1 Tax=unclassified Colwellia TaxID=196834 RepID=UPI0015F3FEF9|nr:MULTISPECIES: chemotaxis protein CheW [unclassified Colwellia]MBA6234111.1 chemotaxis protein CheW [Colwellia sp. MB02u-7]MBA6237967.1 chemotaxis protein CheW [Colwellia sp. MB02u-11]MBA6257720.1 chemotaxis protein CheW [Colwellia sp. MB3u-28]MBA6259477.1 chemotaxis protein CheW [Colwellia sp. MB3u-41]MBA6300785.1 chemotaxis protein CheW [Colwellia sp. MB3u-22]
MDIQMLADEVPVEGEYSLEGIDFITSGEQYLTFLLADEQYAVDILCVEEIRSWENPTRIPNSPGYIKGVINMRGIIVPIVDLRMKFNIGEANYCETTVVIVLTVETENKTRTIGFVVDAVSDVLNVEVNEIKPAPAFGGCVPQNYLDGLVNVGENVVTLLNVNTLQEIEKHQLI